MLTILSNIDMYEKVRKLYHSLKRKGIIQEAFVEIFPLSEKKNIFIVSIEYRRGDTNSFSSANDTSLKGAFIKAVMEAIEWLSITYTQKEATILLQQPRTGISPSIFSIFERETDTAFSKFRWTESYSQSEKKRVLIPTQFVYSHYLFAPNEPKLRIPISTGAAANFDESSALLAGLLEVIERDNFMLYYLTKTSPKIIDFEQSRELKELIQSLKQNYKIYLVVLDFSYDLPVYTIGILLFDENSVVTIGLKTHTNLTIAITQAILEAFKLYVKSRNYKIGIPSEETSESFSLNYFFHETKNYWLQEKPLKDIAFLLKGEIVDSRNYKKDFFKKTSPGTIYSSLTQEIISQKQAVFVKDFSVNSAIVVRKIIIPNYVPLFLSSKFPYKITARIKKFINDKQNNTKQLLTIPPPFY